MRDLEQALKQGLRLIADDGCEHYTVGWCGDEERRTPYAKYADECWCHPCIARATLEGTLPRPIVCIEAEVE